MFFAARKNRSPAIRPPRAGAEKSSHGSAQTKRGGFSGAEQVKVGRALEGGKGAGGMAQGLLQNVSSRAGTETVKND